MTEFEKELKHIDGNTINMDEYPKAFIVTTRQKNNKIKIYVSYKNIKKTLGLITLENTDMLADKQGYYLTLGKGYSDPDFCFMQQSESFEKVTFEETFGDRSADPDKQQIKILLATGNDFVDVGANAMLEILNRFASDETYYSYVHSDWQK